MAVSVEQFVKLLQESGILAADTIRDFIPQNASPKDGEELARNLVRNRRLTKFQAEAIWHHQGRCLVLGNYVLLERISATAMGAVYLAEHRRLKRLAAIKVLPQTSLMDRDAFSRFQRGVEEAARLRHPNIVAVDDADCYSGVNFLVMEFIDGSDLSALVKKDGPFSLDAAINIVMQAAQGLIAAHAEGIVHGDISPGNLLLDKKGAIKIFGMGLARIDHARDAANQQKLTVAGTTTRAVEDIDTADARTDIYSLGCTLFYLLTGKQAYDGDSSPARTLAHQDQPIPSLRALCPEVSESLDAVFGRMTDKNVDHRYQTMADAAADLERCL